jgi:type I restriction enzyme R subunit
MMPPEGAPPIDAGEGTEEGEVIVDVGLPPWDPGAPSGDPRKVYVNNVSVVIVAERVEYLDGHGKLVTESLRDFTRKELRKHYGSLEAFLARWRTTDRKQAVLDELDAAGLPLDALTGAVPAAIYMDPFDLICHVAFDQAPLSRQERARKVRKRDVFSRYGPQARAVLEALLQKYEDDGVIGLDDPTLLKVRPFDAMGTPLQLLSQFGGRDKFEEAVHEMQALLYEGVA